MPGNTRAVLASKVSFVRETKPSSPSRSDLDAGMISLLSTFLSSNFYCMDGNTAWPGVVGNMGISYWEFVLLFFFLFRKQTHVVRLVCWSGLLIQSGGRGTSFLIHFLMVGDGM